MNNESAAVEAVVFDRDAIFRSAEARAKLYALTLLVEGPGCIRWEDGNGFRLKDTDEWVQFYCLVKSMQNFTFRDETQSALDALRGEVAAAERRVAELVDAIKEYRLFAACGNREAIARLDALTKESP